MPKDKQNKLCRTPFSGVSSHSSRSLRESGVLRKYTRKYRKASKKYVYSKKSQRSRKSARYSGGVDKSDEDQIRDLKNIISKYITVEQSKHASGSPESKKYENNKADIITYTTTIASKPIPDLTDEDLAIIQKLVIQIIDESSGMSIFTKGIQKLQKLINKVVIYFINDIELTDNTEFILKKRITNQMPYVDVIRKRDGYETTYDVNEMFALIKSEMNKTEYPKKLKESFLKKLTVNSKMGLEVVPPPPPITRAAGP